MEEGRKAEQRMGQGCIVLEDVVAGVGAAMRTQHDERAHVAAVGGDCVYVCDIGGR